MNTTPTDQQLKEEIISLGEFYSYFPTLDFEKIADTHNQDEFVDELMHLFTTYLAEARIDERRQIEREVWDAKYKEWSEAIDKASHPPIQVVADRGNYIEKLMITDIQYGSPELIRVVVAFR